MRDPVAQALAVFFQLLEALIGGLYADVVFLEVFKNMMIPLPIAVQFIEVFLISGIPGGKDLLLLAALPLLGLTQSGFWRFRTRPDIVYDQSGGCKREAEAGKDFLLGR